MAASFVSGMGAGGRRIPRAATPRLPGGLAGNAAKLLGQRRQPGRFRPFGEAGKQNFDLSRDFVGTFQGVSSRKPLTIAKRAYSREPARFAALADGSRNRPIAPSGAPPKRPSTQPGGDHRLSRNATQL
jgi:hypothetical protein